MYQFESRVRYSEVGADGLLTLNGVLNYFQDCSTFHSEDVGLGVEHLKEKHRAWLLSSWQVVVERYPGLGERIVVATWPYDFKLFYGYRNFALFGQDGERLSYANSIWAFIDTSTGHPTKIGEADVAAYGEDPKLEMNYAPRKVTVPKDCVPVEEFPVRKYHIDTNQHVNNAQYIQMARECIPQIYPVHEMRAEYRKAAVLGDMIFPEIHRGDESDTVLLCDGQKNPYAVVQLMR
ncbi:acyl-[acyl-carrier-protein] thioesterase [Diplocloster agilis]|uniref:Acyl-[acyl-carrier-protein] thioesterase n=1 Tax=Diplocloster agilis TaxID=2850323 RepID=A0A949JZ16_9FIRM|nr:MULTISPECIES: acyl-ACP thioesterase domain-containing protein [Lachnospiraceae]MBU9736689.1 acyl-[acyl-carrier-protein] thioesterase [Diplocloster agilis]MBU9743508.1 acyl-[acyl-carrier-protein] thioesterase [Diplocloster agilis]MCU6734843.1 thioesterase [Suonthocola fibrivorans]SCJ56138.1 Acyl-ACP thioesterase [uncultured Clostridium sp.]